MTKASLTERQAIVSTPFPLMSPAFCTKPGRCLAEQVGVKAPGSAKSTTFLPLKISSVVMSLGPSAVIRLSLPDGIRSPTLIVIAFPLCSLLLRQSAAGEPAPAHHRRSDSENHLPPGRR